LPFEYEKIENRYTDDRSVTVRRNKKYGVADRYGKIIVPVIFDGIGKNIDHSSIEVYRNEVKLHYSLYSNKTIYPNSADIERFGAFKAMPNFGYGNILCVSFDEMFGFMTMDRKILQYPVYQLVRGFEKGHFLVGIQKNNQWGVYNLKTKREVITPAYDDIDLNVAIGFVLLKKGEKWAYANENGELQSEFEYDSKDFFNAIKEKNAKKEAFQPLTPKATQVGKLIFDNLYNMKKEGLVPYKVGAVYGYCNLKGEVVIPPTFTNAHSFIDGLAVTENNGKYGVIDTKGNVIVPHQYEQMFQQGNKLLNISKNGNEGLITTDNKTVLHPIVSNLGYFNDGLAYFKHPTTKKYGYIDESGKEIIPAIYDEVHNFHNGVAEVYSAAKGGTGFIDKKGTLVVPHQYKKNSNFYAFDNTSNLLRARDKNDILILLNREGKKVVDENRKYHHCTPFRRGIAYAERFSLNDGDWIDTLGKVLPIWKGYRGMDNNFSENILIVEHEYINLRSEKIGVPFQDSRLFSNGYAAAKINNQWGFIDTLGNPITAFVYDKVSDFSNDGFASVQIDNYGFIVNTKGECVLNCIDNPIRLQNDKASTYFTADLNRKILNFVPFQKNKKWGYMMRGTKEIIVPAIMDSCAFAATNEIYFVDKGIAYTVDYTFGFSLESEGYTIQEDSKFVEHMQQGKERLEDALPAILSYAEDNPVTEVPSTVSPINSEFGKVTKRLNNKSVCVEKDKKVGIVNNEGKLIIAHQYDKFIAMNMAYLHYTLISEGSPKAFYYYLFEKNGERFYVDENGVEYR
jgi:hypothetical protein